MLKIDCASMIGRFLQQLIDHNFGGRVPTLTPTVPNLRDPSIMQGC